MSDNRAELILALRDEISSGMTKINASLAQTRQAVVDMGTSGEKAWKQQAASFAGVTDQAKNFTNQLMTMVGISVSVGAGLAFVKKSIDSISDTALKSIAGAAMMVSRETIEGVGEQQAAYSEYRAYILNMYKELNAETQNHFASGKEMIGTYNALIQMGIYASKDEAKSVGVITDAVKLLHGGYVDQVTVQHEIRGLLEGHAGIHYKLAQQLSTMIGPEWKEIVQTHAKDGTLLSFLEEKYKGLAVASGDIQKTLTAQQTTLDTLISQIGKAGLAGMYEDITGWVSQINKFLREHKDELASRIASIWAGMRESVYGVASGVGTITTAIAEFGGQLDRISKNPAFMALFGTAAGSRAGIVGAVVGGVAGFSYAMQQRNYDEVARGLERAKREQSGLVGYGSEGEGHVPSPVDTKPPPWKPALGLDKSSGKSAESSLNAMQTMIDRLNMEISRLSEGGKAEVEAWTQKAINDVNKLVAKGADGSEALVLIERAAALKKQKIDDDFYQHIAKESGNSYVAIEAESNKWLHIVGGDVAQVMQIWEVKSRKEWEADIKNYTNRLNLEKSIYDQAAQVLPDLDLQTAAKRKALDLEIEISKYTEARKLNELVVAGTITRAQADEFRGAQALIDQYKRLNFEMENNRGLAGWAWGRGKEADQRGTLKDMVTGLEGGFQNAFSSGLQGVLAHDQNTLKKIGSTMFQGLVGEINKGSITRLFDSGAKAIRAYFTPEPGAGGAAAGGAYAGSLGQAAQGLQEASIGFNANTAQFAAAAGGLLLSGVGVATNSQALVIAGTVLQMAGMAIQIYEALTATTTAASMVVAAGALTTSAISLGTAATMLMEAAIIDSIPFFHEGGIVAHQGWLVAHDGLKPDEVRVIAQRGEGIIKARTMAAYARAGISFDDLNEGRLPLFSGGHLTGPAPIANRDSGFSTVSNDNRQAIINVSIGDIHAYDMTPQEAEKFVDQKLMPVIDRKLGNRARNIWD